MSDKRVFKRIKKTLQVTISSENGTHSALTEDVSAAGFFIKTQKVFPPGSILNISLKGPSDTIEMSCRVVWARKVPSNLFHLASKNGMGVLITEFQKGEDEYHLLYQKKV